jgi:hypothetical protein
MKRHPVALAVVLLCLSIGCAAGRSALSLGPTGDRDATFDSIVAFHDPRQGLLEVTLHFDQYPYGSSYEVYSALLVVGGDGYPTTTVRGAVGGLKIDWDLRLLGAALTPTFDVVVNGGWINESPTSPDGAVVRYTTDRFRGTSGPPGS